MVDRDYLLAQPPGPSALKVKWDQQAMPVLIDAAGAVEAQLDKLTSAVRRVPVTCVLIAAGIGFLAAQAGRARLP